MVIIKLVNMLIVPNDEKNIQIFIRLSQVEHYLINVIISRYSVIFLNVILIHFWLVFIVIMHSLSVNIKSFIFWTVCVKKVYCYYYIKRLGGERQYGVYQIKPEQSPESIKISWTKWLDAMLELQIRSRYFLIPQDINKNDGSHVGYHVHKHRIQS